jgi:hypothetical protein
MPFRRAFGVAWVGNKLAKVVAVQFGEHNEAQGIYFEHNAELIGIDRWLIGLGFEFDIIAEGIADIELAKRIVIHMFQDSVALYKFRGLGPAIFMRLEFGIGSIDVEIRMAIVGINLDKDQSAFEVPRRALHIMPDKMLRLELRCNKRMIWMNYHVKVFFASHLANLLGLNKRPPPKLVVCCSNQAS